MKLFLKYISVVIVKYLQKRYKKITIDNYHNQNNQIIAKLTLIQSILYYFKQQFSAWGYFHPDCRWSMVDEQRFNKLFPVKDEFRELDIVVHHNPEAIKYYHNKIYKLNGGYQTDYQYEIKKQLIEWKDWN